MLEFCNKVITNFCRLAIIIMMPMMVSIIFIQVVMRYIFSAPFSWAEELTRYLLVWTASLGTAYAVRKGLHISMVFLVNKLHGLMKMRVSFFVQILVILFSALCFIMGLDISFSQWNQISPGLRLRLTWPYLSVPFGFGIIILFCIENLKQNGVESKMGSSE